MSKASAKLFAIATVLILLLFAIEAGWKTNEELKEEIYQQNGYTLDMVNSRYAVTFELDKQWMQVELRKEKNINKVLEEIGNSTVILKSAYRSEGEGLTLNIEIKKNFEVESGHFLSHYHINNNGSVNTGKRPRWYIYKRNGEPITRYHLLTGRGSGPGEQFSVDLRYEKLKKLKTPLEIKFLLFKYEYEEK